MPDQAITGPSAGLTLLLVIVVFVVPRRYIVLPFVVTACFMPADQHMMIFGLHFYVGRILVFAGILRIIMRSEMLPVRWNRLDKLVMAWAIVGSIIYVLGRGHFQAVIYKSGVLVDVLGVYWIMRQTIVSWADLKHFVTMFAFCAIALIPFVAWEWSTGRNPFLFLGAVATYSREGELRCMGSFYHPIIAGAFMACLVPMFVAYARTDSRKSLLYWAAVAGSVFVVIACHSSTPLGGLIAIVPLLAMFPFRYLGRYTAIGFFGMLTALHIVMKAPVWHLLARVRLVGGSTGYHRYRLIDAWVRHFPEWAILGTRSTMHWGRHLFDITNQFALESVRGGLLTLILFVAMFFVAIRTAGGFSQHRVPREHQWISWAVGISLVGHCIMFLGLGYFGQIQILLYMTFAVAGFIYQQNALLGAARAATRARSAHYAPAGARYAGVARQG
jgi:uncharacterized membrane protein